MFAVNPIGRKPGGRITHYPQKAEELRPLLVTALLAQKAAQQIHPPAPAQSRSLGRFLSEAQQARQNPRRKPWFSAMRLVYSLAILLIVLFIATGSAVAVSAHALPGQPLYSVKLATENTRLMLATDPRQRLDLEQSFDQERADEVEQLIHLSRSVSVNLTGTVSKINAQEWAVSGIHVLLPAGANIAPDIEDGYQVVVSGLILPDGSIRATKIQPKSFQFSGILNEISSEQWIVDGIRVYISSNTNIQGGPEVGSRVWVSGILLSDGGIQSVQLTTSGLPPVASRKSTSTLPPTQPVSTESGKNNQGGDSEGHTPVPTIQPNTPEEQDATSTPLGPLEPSSTSTQRHGDGEEHPSATPQPSEQPPSATPQPAEQTPSATSEPAEHHATITPTSSTPQSTQVNPTEAGSTTVIATPTEEHNSPMQTPKPSSTSGPEKTP